MIPVERVVEATGAPLQSVKLHWPTVYAALVQHGMTSEAVQHAAIATIGVEVPRFEPIPEHATGEAYEGREDLGNVEPGDGKRFKGRGFIQITGRSNYREYGKALRLNLEGNPNLALMPSVAADILALYFQRRKIPAAAEAGEWKRVRKKVNGGLNGWARFARILKALGAHVE